MAIDSSKTAFVFPGQGSQKIGMGKELALEFGVAKEIFDLVDEATGIPLSNICWEGPEDSLNDTINTQPALLAHSLSALAVLSTTHPEISPAFLAGHSLGQLSALVAAGSLNASEAAILVRKRGELMKSAGEKSPGGMGAILGLDIHTADSICKDASNTDEIVQIANDNCPGQVVISGNISALERAIVLAKEAGARKAIKLAVSIAAHSELMSSAQSEFTNAIESSGIIAPNIPIIGNVSAEPLSSITDIYSELNAQLTSRVRWTESIMYLVDQGISTIIEIGTGNVLSGLIKRIDRNITRLSLGTPQDFDKLATLI